MRIVTYAATDDAPAGHSHLARIQHDDGTWHPVLFASITEGNAREKAEQWWASERAKADKRAGPKKKPPASKEPVQARVGVVADDFEVL